ncbi:MAG: M20/M25/M40 family metallo-hydrolase [candidate division NC10 bacterium]
MQGTRLNGWIAVVGTAFILVGTHEGRAQEPQGVEVNVSEELQTVQQILATDQLKKALQYTEQSRDETIQEFLRVCNANGPAGDEIFRARHLHRLFRIYGLENVHIDDQMNVIGIRRGAGEGPTVVLNAHMDVVAQWPKEQPIQAFVADGRIWCPGASDDLIGVVQLLTILRALNAADIQTKGDVWFVMFSYEEQNNDMASPGAELFVRSNYPHNIDWRKGDILVQLHGDGGQGASTGSIDMEHTSQLRVFFPVDRNAWAGNAVDLLGQIVVRVGKEVRDPRAGPISNYPRGYEPGFTRPADLLYLNMAVVEGGQFLNQPVSEASVRLDLIAATEARLWRAHDDIQRIAQEVCQEMGEGCSYHYSINSKRGTEEGIEGWDMLNNAPARMAAAAAQALYGITPYIIPTRGCGDCARAYMDGMPAMSLRGYVWDFGDGRFEVGANHPLVSQVRRKTTNHDVTGSVDINKIWAAVKQGLLFTVSYAGMAQE